MDVDDQEAQPRNRIDNASVEIKTNASRLRDLLQDHVTGLLAARASMPPTRPYHSSQETSRGDSPPSRQTSEYVDSGDEEKEEEQDTDGKSPLREGKSRPQIQGSKSETRKSLGLTRKELMHTCPYFGKCTVEL